MEVTHMNFHALTFTQMHPNVPNYTPANVHTWISKILTDTIRREDGA